MVIQSRHSVEIPNVSIPSYLFNSPTAQLKNTPLILDARHPDTAYLTQETYRLWSQRLALGLIRRGIKPGDRVLLFSANSIYYPVCIVGTIMASAIFTGANPTYVPRELAYQLTNSGASILISSVASLDTAIEASRIAGLGLDCVYAFDDGLDTAAGRGQPVGNIQHWTSLLASEEDARGFAWKELTPEELRTTTCSLNYSSGTTGVPKGVEITHMNYVSNALQVQFQQRMDPQWEAKNARAKLLCFLPYYHAYGLTVYTFGSCPDNVPTYVMTKFDFVSMLKYIQDFKITLLTLVPPIVVALANSELTRKYDLSSVETIGSGAAPLGREISVKLENLWPSGKINVKQGWGMSEITCSAMGWDPSERSESASVGELNANCEAMVVELDWDQSTGQPPKEVDLGERGELWVRGPNVMKGYWRRPDATAETLINLNGQIWLRTGDIVYVDASASKSPKFFIVDRQKELIKTKGFQVAPAELEALLLDHPAIIDAAVIGVEVNYDEAPRAYVVIAESHRGKVSETDIQKWMNEKVTTYKRLTGGVVFTDLIPKNPSGKILRRQLRDQAVAELKQETLKAKL